MTSTNIVFMIHMRNKYYEKMAKIKQDKIKEDLDKQDQDKENKDKDKENQDKENLINCKNIFKNYLNYLEKKVVIPKDNFELIL
jgi:uncharacterized protein (UPF0305 family)